MTIDQNGLSQSPPTTPSSAGGPTSGRSTSGASPSGTAIQAIEETQAVAAGAAEAGMHVAHEAKAQATEVVGQAKEQFHSIVAQTKDELREQLGGKAGQAAQGLRSLSGQLDALQDGRPQEATQLVGYIGDAQRRMAAYADRIDRDGVQGVVEEITRFARRRPALFLLGAATVGFAAGRALRAGVAAAHEDDGAHASAIEAGPTTTQWSAPATAGSLAPGSSGAAAPTFAAP